MKQQISNKLKSYSFWISVGGAIGLVIQSFARAYGFAFDEAIINDIVTSICGLLVVFGVISAPTIPSDVRVDSIIGKEEKTEEVDKDSSDEEPKDK